METPRQFAEIKMPTYHALGPVMLVSEHIAATADLMATIIAQQAYIDTLSAKLLNTDAKLVKMQKANLVIDKVAV